MSLTPREIVDRAVAEFAPVAMFVGFSGGRDSLAITHWMMNNVPGCKVFHVNTGIGIERTREYVRETCAAPTVAAQPASSEGPPKVGGNPSFVAGFEEGWQARAAQQTAQPDAEREALDRRINELLADLPRGQATLHGGLLGDLLRDLRDYINRGRS